MSTQAERSAANVQTCVRELQERLAQLTAAPAHAKLAHGAFVAAAFFELQNHQDNFNQCVVAALAGLSARIAEGEGANAGT